MAATPDWAVNGLDTLWLYVRGVPSNSPAALYVVIEDSAGRSGVATHADPQVVRSAEWVAWQIPTAEFTAAGVDLRIVKKIYLGVGDRNNPTPGGAGSLYIDDIRVTKPGFDGE
jgi:hypothetical protein